MFMNQPLYLIKLFEIRIIMVQQFQAKALNIAIYSILNPLCDTRISAFAVKEYFCSRSRMHRQMAICLRFFVPNRYAA